MKTGFCYSLYKENKVPYKPLVMGGDYTKSDYDYIICEKCNYDFRHPTITITVVQTFLTVK